MLLKIKLCVLHLVVSDDHSIAVDAWTISFSPDSRFLATGSHSGKINLFGVESGRKEESLDIRGGFTLSIAYVSISLLKFRSQTNWLYVFSICFFLFSFLSICFHGFLSILFNSVFSLSVFHFVSLYLFLFCFLSISFLYLFVSLSISLSYSAIFFSLIIKIWKLSQNCFITYIGKLIKMMFEFFFPFFIEYAGFTRYI